MQPCPSKRVSPASRGSRPVLMGIGLLPVPEAQHTLAAIAQAVCGEVDAEFVVGLSAPPHVTLLHAYCDQGQQREWWRRSRESVPAALSFEVHELAISAIAVGDVHSPRGGMYVGLNVVRGAELAKAHHQVVAQAEAVGARPRGLFGPRYHPHVTLAVLPAVPQLPTTLAPSVTGLIFEGELVLATIGPHGSFAEIAT